MKRVIASLHLFLGPSILIVLTKKQEGRKNKEGREKNLTKQERKIERKKRRLI